MSKIHIIGLGAGDLDQLSVKIYKRLLHTSRHVYVRTTDHPVVEELAREGVEWTSFDSYYELSDQFETVYMNIVKTLVEKAKLEPVIYAVPGHPMLAERTVQLLLEQEDVTVEVVGGHSYLDDLFSSLQIDPIEGFQFVDATSFQKNNLQYRNHLIFCQVYDRMIASEVKLALLEDLPPHYPVTIAEAVGSQKQSITEIPLEKLDRSFELSNVATVYVRPVPEDMLNHTFQRLREVIATLRGPGGCEWDQKQTHDSLRPYLIEEAYELIDAINLKDDNGMIEELGDVLLQIMLHSQIGEDVGYFMVDDVIQGITEKMIYRHPHVFGDQDFITDAEVEQNWETLKQKEKEGERISVLDRIPKSLSPLAKAYELQSEAEKVGFDGDEVEPIWDKLHEELGEVKEAIRAEGLVEIEQEFGDVLFVVANLTRFYNIHPEIALNQTNNKFLSRFRYIEKKLHEQQKDIYKTSLAEMDMYWNESKERE